MKERKKKMKGIILLAIFFSLSAILLIPVSADSVFSPVQFRADKQAVMINVEEGTRRIRVQVHEGQDIGWQTRSITHLDGRTGHLKLRVPDSIPMSAIRIEASKTDPFPSSLYTGKTSFSETADEQGSNINRGVVNVGLAAEEDALAAEENPQSSVEESDIWKWRGRSLYFFNQQRGLQVFSLHDLNEPSRIAQLRMPAVGEQLYLVGEEHVILLANSGNSYWRGVNSAQSEVVLVHHQTDQLSVKKRYSLEGSFVESRMIGNRLYAVTRIWESVRHIDGDWHTRSGLKVYAFDFTDPTNPVEMKGLDLTGEESYYYNAVVTATPDYLFVIPSVYDSIDRENVSWVHAIKIDDPSEPMEITHKVRLGGHLNDKYKLALRDGILTTVSQVWGNAGQQRHTLVENHDLRHQSNELARQLDSLVLAPGETVRATRFDDDRLYVVTFRQIDPLFAVDLSRPRRLKILGHIDIPGWSTYMEIFGEVGRILSVGIEDSRVAISLFDVADPTKMRMSERIYLGDEDAYSWSEGNYDEKAVGFFPDQNLLVLPFTGMVDGSYQKKMQIMDIGDDLLVKRGVIDSDFIARRGKLLDNDKLVVISGQQLRVMDISDRDLPEEKVSLTIAWSADRIIRTDDYLIQLEGGSSHWWDSNSGTPTTLRITVSDDPDALVSELEIGRGNELNGATIIDKTVHLLTSRTESISVKDNEGLERWKYATFFYTHSIDVSNPKVPVLIGTDRMKASDSLIYLGSMRANALSENKILWAPDQSNTGYYSCMRCIGIVEDVMVDDIGFWPRQGNDGWLIVTGSGNDSMPSFFSATPMVNHDDYPDSWVETGPIFLSGQVASFGCYVSSWSGKRHDGRHLMRRIDFSNPTKPVLLKEVDVPGLLKHVYTTKSRGTILFTTRQKTEPDKTGLVRWSPDLVLEASIYDGVNAFLVDSIEIKGSYYSTVSGHGRFILLNMNNGNRWWWDGSESEEGENGLRVLGWMETESSIEELPDISTKVYLNNIVIEDDLLFAFDYGAVEVVALSDLPEMPRTNFFELSVGSFLSGENVVNISKKERKAWIAAGTYGVEILDIAELAGTVGDGSLGQLPQGINNEWDELIIDPLQFVRADSEDFIGSILPGYGWRFQPEKNQEEYAQWAVNHFDFFPDPLDDNDKDGVSNLMEFFNGTEPNNARSLVNPSTLMLEHEEGEMHFALSLVPDPAAIGVNIFAEISEDLLTWKNATGLVQWNWHGPVKSVRLIESMDSNRSIYLRLGVRMD